MNRVLVAFAFMVLVSIAPLRSYEFSASQNQVVPEAIWAPATGGGTWVTSIQITGHSAATTVHASFIYGGGLWQSVPNLVVGLGAGHSVYFDNILAALDDADPSGFVYYGRVGAVQFNTNGGGTTIQVTARTVNGNYGKTLQGLSSEDCYKCTVGASAAIFNVASSATYRTFVGIYNWWAEPVSARFYVIDSNFGVLGNSFVRSFAAFDFQSFNPFVEAGVPFPAHSYPSNVFIYILPLSGTGHLVGFGSTANNTTNDTAAHLLVPYAP